MAIDYRPSTEHNIYPNLIVDERFDTTNPSKILGYRVRPQEGYVFYDSTANDTEPKIDPETGETVIDFLTGLPVEVPVIYYRTVAGLPINYNFNNFPYIAVLRSAVDENYIFGGGGNNDHEIMSNKEETVTE